MFDRFLFSACLFALLGASLSLAEPVRVATFYYYPGIYTNDEGEATGFFVDLMEEAARQEGWELTWVPGTWSEGLERIKSGEVDIVTSAAYTEERAQYMDYCEEPLLTVWSQIFVGSESSIHSVFDLSGLTVAVMGKDYNADVFRRNMRGFGVQCDYLELVDYEALLEAVHTGRADACVINSMVGTARSLEMGLRSTDIVFNPFPVYFTAPAGQNAGILATLDRHLKNWKADPDSIYYRGIHETLRRPVMIEHVVPDGVWHFLIFLVAVSVLILLGNIYLRRRIDRVSRETQFSEEKFSKTFFQAPAGMTISDIETGRYIEVNDAFVSSTGYKREDVVGKTSVETGFIEADARARLAEEIQRHGRVAQCELSVTRADGNHMICIYSGEIVRVEGQQRLLSIAVDITEQRREDRRSKRLMRQLKGILDNAPLFISELDLDGRYLLVSQPVCDLYAMPEDAIVGRRMGDFLEPEVARRVFGHIEEVVKYTKPKRVTGAVTVRGKERMIESVIFPLFDEEGRIVSVGSIGEDITERRQEEAAWHREHRLMHLVLEHIPHELFIKDRQSRFLMACRQILDWRGFDTQEQIQGKTDYDFCSPEEADFLYQREQQIMETGNPMIGDEQMVCLPDGRPFWRLSTKVPFRDDAGEVVGLIGFNQDITTMKQTEEALRHQAEQYNSLLSTTREGYWLVDTEGTILDVNDAYAGMSGYSRDELVGMTIADMEAEQDKEAIRHHMERLKEQGFDTFQSRHRRKDGSEYDVEISTSYWQSQNKFVAFIRDITFRRQIELERERLMTAIEQADETVVITDTEGTIQYVNACFERTTGYTAQEAIGQHVHIIQSDENPPRLQEEALATVARGQAWQGRFINRRKDGSLYTEQTQISPVRDTTGRITNYVAVQRDISRELELEAQYRQAQKMEAVGQLTGGVAHDFNNLLQVINGAADMILMDLDEGSPTRNLAEQIEKAGQRAARLVSQLLLFSRRQIMRPEHVDINEAIESSVHMIGRLIGEHINLQWRPGLNCGNIEADRGMLEQTVLNLCVNARDAMPDGGIITGSTRKVELDEGFCSSHEWAAPGAYVCLSVEDTGHGINQEDIEHIFEPFFTTKEVGKGTGLGLATVYGIVRQHEGLVHVDSVPGHGTRFDLYWPVRATGTETAALEAEDSGTDLATGTETILLTEDDEMVRRLASSILEKAGYRVLVAANGREAVEIFESEGESIDMLILDVVMPIMGGREALQRIREQRPDIKAMFATGYSEEAIDKNKMADGNVMLMHKPFSRVDLLRTVRQVLDS